MNASITESAHVIKQVKYVCYLIIIFLEIAILEKFIICELTWLTRLIQGRFYTLKSLCQWPLF